MQWPDPAQPIWRGMSGERAGLIGDAVMVVERKRRMAWRLEG